jgi:hypothetical protein
MRMKDEEIHAKLIQLESAILKEQKGDVTLVEKGTGSAMERFTTGAQQSTTKKMTQTQRSDLQYFGGIGLILLGLFMLFQHIKVTSGYATLWGWGAGDSIGFIMVPLLLGIGWIFYNSRSVWGWLISAVSIVLIVFTAVSGLRMYFAPISMIGLICMLAPMAIGAAFTLKGMGGPAGLDEAIKKQIAPRDQSKKE